MAKEQSDTTNPRMTLNRDLWNAFKAKCVTENMKTGDMLDRLIRAYLEEQHAPVPTTDTGLSAKDQKLILEAAALESKSEAEFAADAALNRARRILKNADEFKASIGDKTSRIPGAAEARLHAHVERVMKANLAAEEWYLKTAISQALLNMPAGDERGKHPWGGGSNRTVVKRYLAKHGDRIAEHHKAAGIGTGQISITDHNRAAGVMRKAQGEELAPLD